MAVFTGAGVAIVTPFRENKEVDFDRLGELIDYQVEHKTDAIVIVGTTGEASTLTHEEHIECIRYAVQRTAGRVPVVAGTGSNCTETAIYLTKEAKAAGADAALVVTPYYNKATQKGLIAHYGAIAAAVDIPIIMYNVPGRTGCNILPATAAALVKQYDNIVGIKDATGNMAQTVEMMERCEGKIDLYSGEDGIIVPILSVGGKGVISVLSNVAPEDTHRIVELYLKGDFKGSLELQLKYAALVRALFSEVNPIPVKKALELMGFPVGTLRSPLTPMEPEHAELLRAEMKKVGILA